MKTIKFIGSLAGAALTVVVLGCFAILYLILCLFLGGRYRSRSKSGLRYGTLRNDGW